MTKKERWRRYALNTLLISMGIASTSLGLKGFLLPNGYLDGGVIGLSLLASHFVGQQYLSVWVLVLNAPFIYLAVRQVGRRFAVKTMIAISVLAASLAIIPWPAVTHEPLLIAGFGGFFIGAGIGLSIRGGAVIDGTEVLALFLSRRLAITIGDVILMINIIIFSIAALVFDVETAMYSIITYLAASKTVDFLVNGIEEYTGVTIISAQPDAVREAILHELGRGVTVYKGERGYSHTGAEDPDLKIIFTVVTRLELARLKAQVADIDEKAFIFTTSIGEIRGGTIKKRPLH